MGLGRGSEALLRARLLAMQGDPRGATEQSQRALSELRACRAPWWIAKAIRVVESAGAAGRDLVQEAEAIERRLGLSGRAG